MRGGGWVICCKIVEARVNSALDLQSMTNSGMRIAKHDRIVHLSCKAEKRWQQHGLLNNAPQGLLQLLAKHMLIH